MDVTFKSAYKSTQRLWHKPSLNQDKEERKYLSVNMNDLDLKVKRSREGKRLQGQN